MLSWVSKDTHCKKEPELFQVVAEGLRQQYTQKLLPLEENYRFHEFHSQCWRILTLTLSACGFSWASTGGKTTFPLHLVEQDFPGMWTGLSTPRT